MQGFGLGLRATHFPELEISLPESVDWFEAISENFMGEGGYPLSILEKVRREKPVVLHGVSLSIASVSPLREDYLQDLKSLVTRIDPAWVSDHVCWTTRATHHSLDLLPIPYTRQALSLISERVDRIQNLIGKPFLLENVSSYVEFEASEMSEWDFLNELTRRSGCKLLLDVNNVYVSSFNHGFNPHIFIDALAPEAITQIHLAGHSHCGSHIIDTHDASISDEVWKLYAYTCRKLGRAVPAMIERDDEIPPLRELLIELETVKKIQKEALRESVGLHPRSVLEGPHHAPAST